MTSAPRFVHLGVRCSNGEVEDLPQSAPTEGELRAAGDDA